MLGTVQVVAVGDAGGDSGRNEISGKRMAPAQCGDPLRTGIAAARRYYNTTVRRFNSLIQSVPTNIIARVGGFREREFFRIEDDADRAPVAVNLS